jgi:hypothetical protein
MKLFKEKGRMKCVTFEDKSRVLGNNVHKGVQELKILASSINYDTKKVQ